jgi:hypothetical protein
MASLVADLVRKELGNDPRLSRYFGMLEKITSHRRPPFATSEFGKLYRSGVVHAPWFASLLLNDADMEGYSARQLWLFSHRTADEEFAAGLRRHAKDEARHARMFGSLLFAIFPALDDVQTRARLRRLWPVLDKDAPQGTPFRTDDLVNTAVLINLHEIKALFLEKLLHPAALAYSSDDARPKTDSILRALTRDEVEHIRYSALYMERMADLGYSDFISDAMADFLEAIGEVTEEEISENHEGPRDIHEALARFSPISELTLARA